MEHQAKKEQEALWTKKVMALQEAIDRTLSRQWVLMDDRHCREKSPLDKALKIVKQLKILVNDGCIDSEPYRKKLQKVMASIEALGLYDFVSEELIQVFGPEVAIASDEDSLASVLAFIRSMQGIAL